MAKPDPKQLKKEGEDLKALLAKIKKKQYNCAILVSKDGVVIEAHIKKSPDILVKLAKKNGGTAKGAWGTITMDGQVLILDPINDKVPGNLPKLCKTYFGARGLKNRLEIKEPDDVASQADGANDPLAAVDDAVDENTKKAEALKARLDKLTPKIDALVKAAEKLGLYKDAQSDTAGSLKAARQELLSAIEKGDIATAENILAAFPPTIDAIERDITAFKSKKSDGDANGTSPDSEKHKKAMARWLEREKQDINIVLKDKASKHNKNMLKWIGAYNKLLKADKLKEAQQALDEVALVLKAYAKDFKLSEKQRKDIMKRIEGIKEKMLKETDKLLNVNIHTDF